MRFGQYRFHCRFDSAARLPVFKGSTFRGVFGHALKRVVCALKRQDCPGCLLKSHCLYPLVFETQLALPSPDTPNTSAPPHPFVIEPPEHEKTAFASGDPFEFTLLLFGEVTRSLPYFIYAIENMGAAGIGAQVGGQRGRFSLIRVESGDKVIYTVDDGRLTAGDHAVDLHLQAPPPAIVRSIMVHFHTPLRVKRDSRLTDTLPFHVLLRTMLRRLSGLLACYNGGEPRLDYKGLVTRAQNVKTAENRLQWNDWRRYSNRQEKAMMMGGVVGTVIYEGDMTEFMPMMDFCSRVHIGKQTAFGLGRFTATVIP